MRVYAQHIWPSKSIDNNQTTSSGSDRSHPITSGNWLRNAVCWQKCDQNHCAQHIWPSESNYNICVRVCAQHIWPCACARKLQHMICVRATHMTQRINRQQSDNNNTYDHMWIKRQGYLACLIHMFDMCCNVLQCVAVCCESNDNNQTTTIKILNLLPEICHALLCADSLLSQHHTVHTHRITVWSTRLE